MEKYPWVDLSERHLVYSTYDFGVITNTAPDPANWGSFTVDVAATLAQLYEPVAENLCPYSDLWHQL